MKNIVLLLSTLLAGCSFIPSRFDSQEYNHLITLSTEVDQAVPKCGTADEPALVHTINGESKLLLKYTSYTSSDLAPSLRLVDKAITEMDNAYKVGTPSTAYCKLKLNIIDADLQLILKASGDKDK